MLLNKYLCTLFICRHTGGIECANSLSLVYTPKRISFRLVSIRLKRIIFYTFHLKPRIIMQGFV